MFFIDRYSAVSNNLFSTCCIVFLKFRYRDIVTFRTKNWMDENLVIDSLQTSRFALWRGKNIVWSFSMPLWCNKHLPGQSASIIIAFEFFGMFVSLRNPSIFCTDCQQRLQAAFQVFSCSSVPLPCLPHAFLRRGPVFVLLIIKVFGHW